MNILIAVDGSHFSHRAARFGALLAEALDAECRLLGVAESRQDEQELADLLAELSPALGLDPEPGTVVRTGKPVEQILAEIQTYGADLLVVGARGRGMVGRWFLGNTAYQLVERATVPVVIVRRSRPQIRKILVCTAGGPSGRHNVEYAAMIAARTGAELTILHVMSQIALQPGLHGVPMEADASWHIEHGTPEGEHLRELLAIAQRAGASATAEIRHGLVVDEICDEARSVDYDLVAIGAHRGKGFMRFLIDDLTADIIGRLNRPILIVR